MRHIHGNEVVGSPAGWRLIDKQSGVRKVLMGTSCRVGAMTQDQILEFCVASLANVLRVPKDVIQIDTKFSRLGLDSAMTVYLQMELEDKLGLELSPDNFYDYPTVDKLSRHLSQLYGSRPAA
jgi:acyl carrier protein